MNYTIYLHVANASTAALLPSKIPCPLKPVDYALHSIETYHTLSPPQLHYGISGKVHVLSETMQNRPLQHTLVSTCRSMNFLDYYNISRRKKFHTTLQAAKEENRHSATRSYQESPRNLGLLSPCSQLYSSIQLTNTHEVHYNPHHRPDIFAANMNLKIHILV